MLRTVLPALLLALGVSGSALAQPTVFLVRHAERADSAPGKSPAMGSDPDLSDAGRTRAASLAATLKDAGITAIYVTKYKRTQQTAAPLAKSLGLTPIIVTADDNGALAAAIKGAAGNVLVIGHSNTIPAAIKALGISTEVTIGDDDYDDLFIVSTGLPPALVRLHYK